MPCRFDSLKTASIRRTVANLKTFELGTGCDTSRYNELLSAW